MTESGESSVDVLIVGAGPTGLTLAARLRAFGVAFRVIDKSRDRARESRALAALDEAVTGQSSRPMRRFEQGKQLIHDASLACQRRRMGGNRFSLEQEAADTTWSVGLLLRPRGLVK